MNGNDDAQSLSNDCNLKLTSTLRHWHNYVVNPIVAVSVTFSSMGVLRKFLEHTLTVCSQTRICYITTSSIMLIFSRLINTREEILANPSYFRPG